MDLHKVSSSSSSSSSSDSNGKKTRTKRVFSTLRMLVLRYRKKNARKPLIMSTTVLTGCLLLGAVVILTTMRTRKHHYYSEPLVCHNNNNIEQQQQLLQPSPTKTMLQAVSFASATAASPAAMTSLNLEHVNAKLIGPSNEYGGGKCPPGCGCPHTRVDCPRWFDTSDVELSSFLANHQNNDNNQNEQTLLARHEQARMGCNRRRKQNKKHGSSSSSNSAVLDTGGWCLESNSNSNSGIRGWMPFRGGGGGGGGTSSRLKTFTFQDKVIEIPPGHVPPSSRIVTELSKMIQKEGIASINDFGAGVGQYKAAILKQQQQQKQSSSSSLGNLVYKAYDGAGNVEEHTQGFVNFVDLTLPSLDLPKSDWVLSLEVGEHIPSMLEGVFIRNLHHHNCKGIILSWGNLGRRGTAHINNHSNEYIIHIFTKLGYTFDCEKTLEFRNPQGNNHWFEETLMVFRRNQNDC